MSHSKVICPYCDDLAIYVNSSVVYGTDYGMIYLCKPCHAYVGVHKGTSVPLGSLANSELREARKLAHYHFDKLWKTGRINKIWKTYLKDTSNRKKAYLWLSAALEINPEDCHIGMFNLTLCNKTIGIIKQFE